VRLDQLPFSTPATVVSVRWNDLTPSEAKRLRNLGLDEGVRVEALHAGLFGRNPLAIMIGRTKVAIRRSHAQTISVDTAP
jgi:ferrous iron transport protein A